MSAFESKYSWRKGYKYKVDANVVGKVLEKIERRNGSVTTKAFLEESRSKKCPTHFMFEWDDTIAAEKYRLSQAAMIINQIECVVEGVSDPVPAFVNVKVKSVKKSAVFINIETAIADDEMRAQLLQNALRELKAFEKKYQGLQELDFVYQAIKAFETSQKTA